MGNQPSKDGSNDGKQSAESGPSLDSYPSFSKADTKESVKSLRGAIRSKIPGTSKSDSPRNSIYSATSVDGSKGGDKSDASSIASANTEINQGQRGPIPRIELPSADKDDADEHEPPPSPTHSKSLGEGHSHVDSAQQSGEVDQVSDAPPSGTLHPSSNQKPKESILLKTPQPSPRSRSKLRSLSRDRGSTSKERRVSTAADGSLDIGALKSVDLDEMIQRLLDAGYAGKVTKTVCLKNAEITAICQAVREVFLSQPALLELSPPVKIVGDVHGQYVDLLRMFEMCGFPPNSNYLFLGDYVDRGKQSLETILLLMCYKLKFPENFFLLRGNHESANVTRVYGFYDECKRRCNIKIWKTFVDAFNCLPIASIVAGKIFCVHGGLSPQLEHMDNIRQIARPTDVPDYGLLNDLLWSDPAENLDHDWESNERGVSYCFGSKVIMDFLQKHDFDLVCRAHMVVEDGYEFFKDRILVTVFSAPNVGCSLLFEECNFSNHLYSIAANLTIGAPSCRFLVNYCAVLNFLNP